MKRHLSSSKQPKENRRKQFLIFNLRWRHRTDSSSNFVLIFTFQLHNLYRLNPKLGAQYFYAIIFKSIVKWIFKKSIFHFSKQFEQFNPDSFTLFMSHIRICLTISRVSTHCVTKLIFLNIFLNIRHYTKIWFPDLFLFRIAWKNVGAKIFYEKSKKKIEEIFHLMTWSDTCLHWNNSKRESTKQFLIFNF